MSHTAALAIPKFFTLRLWKTRFLLKTFLLHDSKQFDVNIMEIHFTGGTVINLTLGGYVHSFFYIRIYFIGISMLKFAKF